MPLLLHLRGPVCSWDLDFSPFAEAWSLVLGTLGGWLKPNLEHLIQGWKHSSRCSSALFLCSRDDQLHGEPHPLIGIHNICNTVEQMWISRQPKQHSFLAYLTKKPLCVWSKIPDIVLLMLVCDFVRLEPLLNEWFTEDFNSIYLTYLVWSWQRIFSCLCASQAVWALIVLFEP